MRARNLEKEAAIKTIALKIIAEEGLENLSMQKLAKAANISPRTIYLKYENKEDLLVKLFIEEVLGNYERHLLSEFHADINFEDGMRVLWNNTFNYFTANRHAFSLMQYGKISPLLNQAFLERNIQQGDHFGMVHLFIRKQIEKGTIKKFDITVYRTLLFAPLFELIAEYFDHLNTPQQLVTAKVLESCLLSVVQGVRK